MQAYMTVGSQCSHVISLVGARNRATLQIPETHARAIHGELHQQSMFDVRPLDAVMSEDSIVMYAYEAGMPFACHFLSL
jgi:hypothetical protein